MTQSKFTEGILYESHSLGIADEVMALSKQLREGNRTLDFHGSIEQAFNQLTK